MKIHVFTSDILPLRDLPTSGGGLRSWQIISGLKTAGLTVSYSMPNFTFLYKANEASMTQEDRAMSWSHSNQHLILQKFRPQVAIWCSPYSFSLASTYRSDCMLVVDLHGPTNIESCYISGRNIKDTTRELVEKLARFDHFVTVCKEQQHYFSGLLCAAGIPTRDIGFSIVPVSVPREDHLKRTLDDQFSMIFSGGFYPWQDPSQILMRTGRILDDMGRGILHICGSPHKNLSSARIDVLLSELSKMKRVKLHGYVTHDALVKRYASSWCALDLMPRNLERDLAFTTRTVEYLAFGIPPIYNNYAPLAEYISRFDAGWCLDPGDLKAYEEFLVTLVSMSKAELAKKSANAVNLSQTELSPQKTIKPLVEICKSPRIRSSRENNRLISRAKPGQKQKPRVAVFTQDNSVVRQLRVIQPLDALKHAGLIGGYTVFYNLEEQGPDSLDAYDAIWVQRTGTKPLLELLKDRPFLFDIDDLLIGRPSYTSVSVFQGSIIESLLSLKCTLSVTHGRLHSLLRKYTKSRITDRVFITPNGFNFPKSPIPSPTKPTALIWTSIDTAALTTSYEDVLAAVDAFSSKRKVPVYLIGRFDEDNGRRRPANAISFGRMDFWQQKAFLASQPTMIGICPLETHADEATLDFVAAKSDLKMVEYGGFGHPGVYSQSPPYSESDLKTGILTLNTSEHWMEALETAYETGYERSSSEAAAVQELRRIDRLAKQNWYPALEDVLLQSPVSKVEILGTLSAADKPAGKEERNAGSGNHKFYEKAVLLFGAGAGGAQTYFSLPKSYNCVAFIDNDISKQKTKLFGKPVIAPENIEKYKYDSIIISSMFSASIEEQLLKIGVAPERIEKGFS
jgi:hypothetical protein